MGCAISGSISLPCPGFFSPFPHGTGCTIGDKLYLALRSGLRRFTRGSTCSVLLRYHLNSIGFLHTGLSPSMAVRSRTLRLTCSIFFSTSSNRTAKALFEGSSGGPTTPISKLIGLGFSAFARRYLRNLFDFSSSAYLDVSVQPVPSSQTMYSSVGHMALPIWGFPIRTRLDQCSCAAPQAVSPLTRPSSATCP